MAYSGTFIDFGIPFCAYLHYMVMTPSLPHTLVPYQGAGTSTIMHQHLHGWAESKPLVDRKHLGQSALYIGRLAGEVFHSMFVD